MESDPACPQPRDIRPGCCVCSSVCESHCLTVHFILFTPPTVGGRLSGFQFGVVACGLDFKVSTEGAIVSPSALLASPGSSNAPSI